MKSLNKKEITVGQNHNRQSKLKPKLLALIYYHFKYFIPFSLMIGLSFFKSNYLLKVLALFYSFLLTGYLFSSFPHKSSIIFISRF